MELGDDLEEDQRQQDRLRVIDGMGDRQQPERPVGMDPGLGVRGGGRAAAIAAIGRRDGPSAGRSAGRPPGHHAQGFGRPTAGPAARRRSVLEEQLAVLRQRPEVVVHERLELVGDLAQGVLGRDDLVAEDARLLLHRARLVGLVLGMLERADRVDQLVGQAGDPLADRVDAARRRARRASWPRYLAVAGRIIVEAMSSAQFASMFWTLT